MKNFPILRRGELKRQLARYLKHNPPPELLHGPLSVEMAFVFPYPASWPTKQKTRLVPKDTPPNLGKLIGLVKDVLRGSVYRHEWQIAGYERAGKFYGPEVVVMIFIRGIRAS